jgi:GntR family transcriptional regulator
VAQGERVHVFESESRAHKVRALVLEYIERQGLGRGDRLPSEPEMAAYLGVSRNTLREAYVALEAEGQVSRRHGIGTFVTAPPMITDSLGHDSLGFVQRIEAAGYEAVNRDVVVEAGAATPDAAQALGIAAGAPVTVVRRVIHAGATPAVHITDVLAASTLSAAAAAAAFDGNMLEVIMKARSLSECSVRSRFAAAAAPDDVAVSFRLRPGAPVIRSVSTLSAPDGTLLSYVVAFINSRIIEMDSVRVLRRRPS